MENSEGGRNKQKEGDGGGHREKEQKMSLRWKTTNFLVPRYYITFQMQTNNKKGSVV